MSALSNDTGIYCVVCGQMLVSGEYCRRCWTEMNDDFSSYDNAIAQGCFDRYDDSYKELNFNNMQ